jgi:hypothetical protein
MRFEKKNSFNQNKKTIVVGFGAPFNLRNASKHSYITYTYWLTKFKDQYNIALISDFENFNHVKNHDKYLNSIFDCFIMNEKKEITTWDKFISECMEGYQKLKGIIDPVSFVEVFGIMSSGVKYYKPNFLNKGIKENKFINFMSTRKTTQKFINHYSFVKTFNIPWNHFLHDPQESNHSDVDLVKELDYRRFFIYDSKLFKTQEHPFIKIYHSEHLELDNKKEHDWCIGFTCLTPDRKYVQKLYDKFYSLQNSNIFLQDKYKNIFTNITKEEYIEYLKKSKYTLILPGYDKNAFSPRFIEALTRGVIPFIHNSVYVEEGIKDKNDLDKLLIDDSFDISDRNIDDNFLNNLIDKYIKCSQEEIKLSITKIL